jgi:hypothetical protein
MIGKYELAELLGEDDPPVSDEARGAYALMKPPDDEVLVDEAPKPKSRPMGANARAMLERSRSYPIGRVRQEVKLQKMKRVLAAIQELAVENSACLRAGISITTLKYWLQQSSEGLPGYDIPLDEGEENETGSVPFHEAWDLAFTVGIQRLEAVGMRRAMGYRETLTYQGRVMYRLDPRLQALGFEGVDAYLLDEFGAPIPETIDKIDTDLWLAIMKARLPQVYGNKTSVDFNVRGGVLAIPIAMPGASPTTVNDIEENYRRSKKLPEIAFDVGEDDE